MSDSDEDASQSSTTKIPRFNGRRGEDYGLWRLRLRAACRVKGVWNLVDTSRVVFASDEISTDGQSSFSVNPPKVMSVKEKEKRIDKLEKASGIIISALGNEQLRVLAEVNGEPMRMLQLLDARYASNRTVSRIAIQTQLYRMTYSNQDMSRYIDEYTGLFSQLEFMGKDIAIPEAHKAPMLLASINPSSNMETIAAALRTKESKELTWDFVATSLIDEYNSKYKSEFMLSKLNKQNRNRRHKKYGKLNPHRAQNDDDDRTEEDLPNVEKVIRTLAATLNDLKAAKRGRKNVVCDFRERDGHNSPNCFLNPCNPSNRLSKKMNERMMIGRETSPKKQSRSKKDPEGKVELAGLFLATISATSEKNFY